MRSAVSVLGAILLAAAFVLAGYDATRSIAERMIQVTKLGDVWSAIHRNSLLLLQPAIERHVEPWTGDWLWDPVMLTLLTSPAWLVPGLIGLILFLLGRKRAPPPRS